MPELPEVETVKRVIEPQIANTKIMDITVNRPEVIAYPNSQIFCDTLIGQSIIGMERHGKFLQVLMQDGGKIIIHLRMTGCLLVVPNKQAIEKHTHIIMRLNNGQDLRFIDTRRFGRWWYIPADTEDTYSGIHKLGPEPFDKNLTAEYLKTKLGKCKKTIKECLLDQSVIAGIGNIYSDEILYAAKIRPDRSAGELTEDEYCRLKDCICEQLTFFIEKKKITPEEYLIGKGQDYRNTPYLKVYSHAGKPCPICNNALQKILIGGRSSVFCPNCQR
jgi:formamidopyrimidine-DNA glycosylase